MSETISVVINDGEVTIIEVAGNTGPQGIPGETGDTGPEGDPGPQGDAGPTGQSAYELAVELGFVGTEQDWLDELAAPEIKAFPNDPPGNGTLLGELWINTVTGDIFKWDEAL